MNIAVKKNTERIRGPKVEILVKRANGIPFVEGLTSADEKGLVVASSKRLDKALVGSEEWQKIINVFPCWSGTMTAYTKPGEKLGKTVEYIGPQTKERWVFRVPPEYQNEKNAILVAEHPEYKLEVDAKNIVVHATAVDLVANFPTSDGLYPTDEKHGIPTEAGSSDKRYLWRIDSRIGPVARVYDLWFDYSRHYVNLVSRSSVGLGMAVEKATEGGAPKVEASELSMAREGSQLIVRGTPEQLDAAAKLLEQLKGKK